MLTSAKLALFGHHDSGHAYKVALALRLGKIDYDYRWVDIDAPYAARPPEFLAASRWGEVPCLLIDDAAYTQSGAILIKLARDYGILGGAAALDAASEWIIWEANRIGMCVPQLIGDANGTGALAPEARAWLRARYTIDAGRLDAALAERCFLLGQSPSIADMAVYGYVHCAPEIGLPVGDHIKSWLNRIRRLDGFQTAQQLLGR